MLAREGAWLPSCDLPYHTRRWKFISVGGATQELLARIRANQNSANETAFAIVCVMPYRRDMYWFPRARGCNSCAGRGLPRHQCERGSAIRQPRSCENVDLRAKLFLWASRKKKNKKKIPWREPGGGPPTSVNPCTTSLLGPWEHISGWSYTLMTRSHCWRCSNTLYIYIKKTCYEYELDGGYQS